MPERPTGSTDRFARGSAVLAEIAGPQGPALLNSLAGIAPDLARLTIEFGYGDIYTRPGLTLPQRQIVNVAALTALGHAAPQLRFHIDGALNVGVGAAQVVETIVHMSVYAGFPAALNGLAVARQAFEARPDLGWRPEEGGPRPQEPEETARERHARGLATLREVVGPLGEATVAAVAETSPELARHIVEFAFGDVYARPSLDLRTRSLVTVAACTTLGTAGPQLRVHLHAFLDLGGTREEVVELMTHLAGYAGFPAALNGVAAAREVFAERDARGERDAGPAGGATAQ
ncbi:carboxymuconolactone decarboxylase family protein [Streptomyces sp. NPDC001941]|uniref:carboxymuconolactone decarboxylase family protein n=1 Tax=Streptomyces sp. NPDC001941 TaxID=3154659 RepID=UPI00332420AC